MNATTPLPPAVFAGHATTLGRPVLGFIAVAAALGCAVAACWAWSWISGRYEFTLSARRGLSARRRWYGGAAHVIRRTAAGDDAPDRFAVLGWWDETRTPWLWVVKLDPEYLTYWDEGAEPFWARVTDFAPYLVRRFRPHVWWFGRVPLPWLTTWLPPRNPAGFLGGAPDAA